jgi:glycine/D-amino acid oxidase-like deaminating enzyme
MSIAQRNVQTSLETFDVFKELQARHNPACCYEELQAPENIVAAINAPSHPSLFHISTALLNPTSGFARASDAMATMLRLCQDAGVRFEVGDARRLLFRDDECTGVELQDGRRLSSPLIVLACGGWTPTLCPDLRDFMTATGQVVATVRLTEDEMPSYSKMPVMISTETGL